MLIGYARVSTQEQDTAAQAAALKAAGCKEIYKEYSGGCWDRPKLQELLTHLRKGDVVVVSETRSVVRLLRDVLTLMERIQERQAGFRSLTEAIDTTIACRAHDDADGRRVCRVRARHAQGTHARGVGCGAQGGRVGGRPPKLKPQQRQEIVRLVRRGRKTAADAARLFGAPGHGIAAFVLRELPPC